MGSDNKVLHSANLLVCVGALATATGVVGAAAAITTGLISWRELRRLPSEAASLTTELARTMEARLGQPDITEDQRVLIPQMIEASLPTPREIIEVGLEPAPLIERMVQRIHDSEQRLPGNLVLFRSVLDQAFRHLLNDPAFTNQLAPDYQRAVLARLTALCGALAELTEKYGDLSRAMGNLEDLHRSELEALAFRFNLDPAADATAREMLELLRSRAAEVRELERELETLRARFPQLGNVIAEALDRLNAGDTQAVRHMVRDARRVLHDARLREALEQDAEFVEIDARALLLEQKPEEAFTHLSAAADSFAAIDPMEPARRRVHYADRLYQHGLRYGGAGLMLAAQMNEGALHRLDPAMQPALWGRANHGLAKALRNLGSRVGGSTREQSVARAVQAFRATLEVTPRGLDPYHWAMVQNDLASTLRDQAFVKTGAQAKSLYSEVVAACRAALTVYTREDYPWDWARVHENLGLTYSEIGYRDRRPEGVAFFEEAIKAFRAALTVYTFAEHPRDFATAHINLGRTLCAQGPRLGGAAGVKRLTEAIDALKAGMLYFTPTDFPVFWAQGQENLAIARWALSEQPGVSDPPALLAAALENVEAALKVFDTLHLASNHKSASTLRDNILARLPSS